MGDRFPQPCYDRRVNRTQPHRAWRVDLASGVASCDAAVLRFDRCVEKGLRIAFVDGADRSLELQCMLAGEATAAIQAKLLRG